MFINEDNEIVYTDDKGKQVIFRNGIYNNIYLC